MTRPIVGIISNTAIINDQYEVDGSGKMNAEAISDASGAIPLIFPANPRLLSVNELLETCDGFLLTGGRPNVHPEEYGELETLAHGDFDRHRDSLALPLVRACVERGQPFFGICRGFQEVNVAMGGSLYPEIRDLPGRMNHRMPPDGTIEEKFAHRHEVTFSDGGPFSRVLGTNSVMTNSLHGQGIKKPGDRICIDGHSKDGTPEAIYVKGSPGFTLSVQWHPEYRAIEDSTSVKLFAAFGRALNRWKKNRRN
tara:strand:+ start:262 stop:1020 length:759 start_codon:yes stop_codon:yes gene_type:complete